MPDTIAVMGRIRETFLAEMAATPSLRDCHLACGLEPLRDQPPESDVAKARAAVGALLGLTGAEAEAHHPASPLKHAIFSALTAATKDPDTAPATWLRDGAPLGILNPIPPGGHFPLLRADPTRPAELQRDTPICHRATLRSQNRRRWQSPSAGGASGVG